MKKHSQKLTGNDVYICIDNSDNTKLLTICKPYRALLMYRQDDFLYILIKANNRQEMWFKLNRFRPRNIKDDR